MNQHIDKKRKRIYNVYMISIYDYFGGEPVIETKRLLLRKVKKKDTHDMYEYSCDGRVSEYLLWSPHPNEKYTKSYISSLKKQYKNHTFFDFAVIYKENGKMIGTCGFSRVDAENSCVEIGYVLSHDYWGMGIAAEAAREMIRLAFEEFGFNRVEARYMTENIHSARVMEKLGMKKDGVLRSAVCVDGVYHDVGYYSILNDEYNGAVKKDSAERLR